MTRARRAEKEGRVCVCVELFVSSHHKENFPVSGGDELKGRTIEVMSLFMGL